MKISRAQLKYTYSRFNFTRPSHAYYPENSIMPGKQCLHGETRMCYMSDGNKGVMVEPGTTNLIPLNKQKFEGWTAYGDAVITLTQNIAVPEWGALAATRIQTSGGTSITKYRITLEAPSVSGKSYSQCVYIKNIGTTSMKLSTSIPGGVSTVILPGESRLVKNENVIGNGTTNYLMDFQALDAADSLDFIAWRPMAEARSYCTSWTDGTRAPETLSVPGLPTVEGEIEFTAEITDKCKRQVVGEYPKLVWMARANGNKGLTIEHSESTATYQLRTDDDTGANTYVNFADSLIPNGTRTLKIKITSDFVTLYCDGAPIAQIGGGTPETKPKLPSVWGKIYLGTSSTGTNHADAIFEGIKMMAADSTVLSNILFTGYDFARIARTIQL